MFAFKTLAIFITIMFGLVGVPMLFTAIWDENIPPLAMSLMPFLMIVSLALGTYLALQLGKQQI